MSSNKLKKTKIPDIKKSVYRKNGVILFLSSLLIFLIIIAVGTQVILYETHKKLDVKYLSALVDYNEDTETVDDEVYEDKLIKRIEKDSVSKYEKGYPTDKLGAERCV